MQSFLLVYVPAHSFLTHFYSFLFPIRQYLYHAWCCSNKYLYSDIIYKEAAGEKGRRASKGASRALVCGLKIRGGYMKIRYLDSLSQGVDANPVADKCSLGHVSYLHFLPFVFRIPFVAPEKIFTDHYESITSRNVRQDGILSTRVESIRKICARERQSRRMNFSVKRIKNAINSEHDRYFHHMFQTWFKVFHWRFNRLCLSWLTYDQRDRSHRRWKRRSRKWNSSEGFQLRLKVPMPLVLDRNFDSPGKLAAWRVRKGHRDFTWTSFDGPLKSIINNSFRANRIRWIYMSAARHPAWFMEPLINSS